MNNPMMTSARLCGGAKMMTIVEMRIAYMGKRGKGWSTDCLIRRTPLFFTLLVYFSA